MWCASGVTLLTLSGRATSISSAQRGDAAGAFGPIGALPGGRPPTSLLAEDDDATRTFLADNLSADGYDLLVADCAAVGLSLIERKFPDLALADVGLPDGSGFELLRRVRSADGVASRMNPDMPLMVISGRVTELDRIRGFD